MRDALRAWRFGCAEPLTFPFPVVSGENFSEHLNFTHNQTVFCVVIAADNQMLDDLKGDVGGAQRLLGAEALTRMARAVRDYYSQKGS